MRDQPSPVVSTCAWFCVWGAAEGLTRKVRSLPTLRGGQPQCRRDPGLFVLCSSHSVDRDGCGVSGHARESPAFCVPAGDSTTTVVEDARLISPSLVTRPPSRWSVERSSRGAPLLCLHCSPAHNGWTAPPLARKSTQLRVHA